MSKELKWLVGIGLTGATLLQVAANTRVEIKLSAAAPSVVVRQG